MSNLGAGKVRFQTAFVPSKHITAKQARQIHSLANPPPPPQVPGQTPQPPPFFYTTTTSILHDNQRNRKKDRTGRNRKRFLFNTRWNDERKDHHSLLSVGSSSSVIQFESTFSLVYPKMNPENGFYDPPKSSDSINSIQTQFHREQREELQRIRTIQNRAKRNREKLMKKMMIKQTQEHQSDEMESSTNSTTLVLDQNHSQEAMIEQRIQALMQTPPLRAAPRTAPSHVSALGWSSRTTALTNVTYFRPGGKMH
ncbi:hypothetical protein C9374_007513 [Naegleria lovaniensis]|uniref:Uncharacterized protein n=1 Tax=Naegleria lovaniensis TaxID=51637 RepID=A0AA88GH92_NAELO|nr:uncharacterized protein C9374_007513 [Naegleria lovaniensis]KAG2379374.1 hypothetical protein C9374_007513 [Naegleria lovaniensis]